MAKQSLQTIGLDSGIETMLPCDENATRLKLLAQILRAANALAVYLQSRRATVESFIPRQSREDERRLEFARFMHW